MVQEKLEQSMTEDEKVEQDTFSKSEDIEQEITNEERVEDEVIQEIEKKLHPAKKEPKPLIYEEENQEDEDIDLKEIKNKAIKSIKNIWQGFKQDKEPETKEEKEFAENRDRIIKFVKEKWNYLIYAALAIIIWFGSHMRIQNLPLLKDVTNGKYIPVALDPHMFLRYAQYTLEHGQLMASDLMRNFPLGYHYTYVMEGFSGFILIIYKILHFINSSITLELADILTPVISYALSAFFIFLLVKKLFNYRVALLSSLFLTVAPTYIYRTTAGFSDHDAPGMMFFLAAFYFYVAAFQSKERNKAIILGLLSGISTAFAGLVWPGGNNFLYLVLGSFILIEIFLNKFTRNDFLIYISWFLPVIIILVHLKGYLSYHQMATSLTTATILLALGVSLVYFLFNEFNLFQLKEKIKGKIPLGIFCFIIVILFAIIGSMAFFGPSFLTHKISEVTTNLLTPFGQDRWQLTVAESHQPYIEDWFSQMGKYFVWFLLIGSAILFYETVKPLRKKNRTLLTIIYSLFILAFIFSRYSRGARYLNGVSTFSKTLYFGSLIAFVLILGLGYLYAYYKNKTTFDNILKIEKKYIFVFLWFFFMAIAARSAIRLLFVFAPITVILVSYFFDKIYIISSKLNDKLYRYAAYIIIILVLFSPFGFAKGMILNFSEQSKGAAKWTGPSYNRQWQLAGQWIRENTPLDAVFGHWWDYGYWVQTGGERATVTDGGNHIGLWNYFMGRHALIGQNQTEALEFLYAHNTTHFLIIKDEIGKYTAFSSIGGGINYERYSWINTFTMQPKQTQETRDGITYFYQGSNALDETFTYNGITYPAQASGMGAILLKIKKERITNGNETQTIESLEKPEMIMINQGKQENVPLNCVFLNNQMYLFDGSGYDGCFRIMPTINGGKLENPIGAGLLVSERGFRAIWTQLFLFNQKNPRYDTSAYELVYSDEESGMPLALYDGRLIGPLKIWEIHYPKDIKFNPFYLERSWDKAGLQEYRKI